MSKELIPCWFCGGTTLKPVKDTIAYLEHACHVIVCMTCGATGPNKRTPEEALLAWNTRTSIPPDLSPMSEIKPCPQCHSKKTNYKQSARDGKIWECKDCKNAWYESTHPDLKPFVGPFRYDEATYSIDDADGKRVLELQAVKYQIGNMRAYHIGHAIAAMLNGGKA